MSDKKRRTREEIRQAILRIEYGRPKLVAKECCRLNISTVAREAGISAASIHNTYPDIAKVVRAKGGKDSRFVLDVERLARKRLVRILRLLRGQLRAAEKDISRIASENARLVAEISVLKARVASRNSVKIAERSKTQGRQPVPFDFTPNTEE